MFQSPGTHLRGSLSSESICGEESAPLLPCGFLQFEGDISQVLLNCLSYLKSLLKFSFLFQIKFSSSKLELYIPNLGQKVTASDDMDGRRNIGEDPALLVCHILFIFSQESIKFMRAKKNTCCLVLEVMRLHNLKLLHGNDAFDAFEVMRPHNLKLLCGNDSSTLVSFHVEMAPLV